MQVAVALIFIWVGFICSISFFESWIKFRAQGVTVPIALSIGKLVFTVLNRIEWVLGISVLIVLFSSSVTTPTVWIMTATTQLLLLLQTIWLLPALNKRALLRIDGKEILPSKLHVYFVVIEFIKLVTLIIFGFILLNL